MAGCCFSVLLLLLTCVVWSTWLNRIANTHQDACGIIRYLQFLEPEKGHFLEGHVFLNLSIGVLEQCEEQCLRERECVSINIGPVINDIRACELSNSDHFLDRKNLKARTGWTYRGTVNICATLPCLNNGKCYLGYTGKIYMCECPAGFTGEICEKDDDECMASPSVCDANANCENTVGSYVCSCKVGFSGDGKTCTDIDECADSHNCSSDAVCNNTKGSFNCSCNSGYSGDGRNCTNIDECTADSHNCSSYAVCNNTKGSYNCSCNPGYSGNVRNCTDVDECVLGSHDCLPSVASCINTAGSYNCVCSDGYVGDGKTSCQPAECINYQALISAYRKDRNETQNPAKNDSLLGPGWFRFLGDAGTKMAASCVTHARCGTHSTGWMKGSHPDVADGKVTRKACFSWAGNCCYWSINIQVRNCDDYFVYYIDGTPYNDGNLGYCSSD